MVRTVESHHVEEEGDDDEFVSRTPDGSFQQGEGKNGDRKVNTNRSKHSETEQRRRSKINERFQILRELIPENDQKRDKASFLLEVIQYIQFLQEKVHMYEGTYQGWSSEPSKLIPWRNNCGPVESFNDQSQLVRNGSAQEGNISVTPEVFTNAHNSIDSDFSGETAYKATDHGAATQTSPLNIPLPTNLFGGVTTQPPQGSFPDAEHLTSQLHSPLWHARPCTAECAAPSYTANEPGEPKIENGGAISNACSQGLLNTLTHALESSGVDLSQTSISVQLDIGKHTTNSGMTSMPFGTKDHENLSSSNQEMSHYGVGSSGEESDQARKRLRTEQS